MIRELLHKFDLQIPAGLANADPILLAEALEQLDALLEHAVPGIAMRVLQWLTPIERPFLKQGSGRILMQEIGRQSTLKGAPEEHGRLAVLLLPAIEIAMPVAPWAGEVLADLGVAVDHYATSDPRGSSPVAAVGESSCHRLSGANPSRLRTEMPCAIA